MTDESTPSSISPSGEATKAMAAKFLMAAIGFIGNIYFARILGPEKIGSFYLFVAVSQFLGRPMAGVNAAVRKRASEAGTSISQSIGAQGLFAVVWFGLVAVALFLTENQLSTYIGIETAWIFVLVYFATELAYATFVPILQARGQIGFSFGLDALRSYVEIPLQFVLITMGFGIPGLVAGLVIANIVALPIAIRGLGTLPTTPSRKLVSSIISYAKFSVPNTVVGTAYGRFDTFLLGALLSQSVVGNYGVAARLTMPALFVATSVSSITFVRVSHGRSEDSSVSEDITNALSFSSILAVPILFGGAVIAEPLIDTIYGTAYAGAAMLLVAIGIQRVFESQVRVLFDTIGGFDRPDITFRVSLAALILNILLGVVLVYHFGPIGVVIATIVAEILRYSVGYVFVSRAVPESTIITTTFLKQLFAGGLMAVVVYATSHIVSINGPIGLAILLVVGAVVYSGTLIITSQRVRTTTLEVASMTLDRVTRPGSFL